MRPEKSTIPALVDFKLSLQDLMGLGFLNGTVYILKLSCLSSREWAAPGLDTEDKKS